MAGPDHLTTVIIYIIDVLSFAINNFEEPATHVILILDQCIFFCSLLNPGTGHEAEMVVLIAVGGAAKVFMTDHLTQFVIIKLLLAPFRSGERDELSHRVIFIDRFLALRIFLPDELAVVVVFKKELTVIRPGHRLYEPGGATTLTTIGIAIQTGLIQGIRLRNHPSEIVVGKRPGFIILIRMGQHIATTIIAVGLGISGCIGPGNHERTNRSSYISGTPPHDPM